MVAVLGLVVGCQFAPVDEVPERAVSLVDDGVEDFADGARTDATIAPWGAIEPEAFVIGGLHARAFAGDQVVDDDEFDDVVARIDDAPALGAGYQQLLLDRGNTRPRGLGLVGNDNYTLLYDGEIQLPAGSQQLELVADDHAVVEVAIDGRTFDKRVRSRGNAQRVSFEVAAAGWYPIRIAYAKGGGNHELTLAVVQGLARTEIGADLLRARVTDEPGLIAFAFADRGLTAPRGETAVATFDAMFGAGAPPFDLDIGIDQFAIREIGQLRVDAPGTFTFGADVGLDADDQFRIYLDDQLVAARWLGAPAEETGAIELGVGWHDIVLDYTDNVGIAQIAVLEDGAPIDPARLRPVVAHGLVAAHVDPGATAIPDLGELDLPLDLVAPADAVIDEIDVGFGIQNHQLVDLTVTLADCADPHVLPTDNPNPAVAAFFYFASDPRCAGTEVAPTPPWQLHLVDAEAGNGVLVGPVVFAPVLVASYHGGPRTPFPRGATFVSAPRPTPGAVRLDAARVIATGDATVELALRTADDEAALAEAPWTILGEGSKLPAAGELLQYQVVIRSDGWQRASVDRVEIEYTAQ